VEFATGARMRITGPVDASTVRAMIAALAKGKVRRLTLGADKAYDTKSFVADLPDFNVAPHVAQNTTNRASAIDCPRRGTPATA